jgi:hypothetical protein
MLIFGLTSCELLNNSNESLTTEEIIEGLKTALEIGADSASVSLSKIDGYYKGNEQFVKIPLPEEAENVRNTINNNSTLASISDLIDLDDAFENVILAVNRAAEDAAQEAAPIFKDAIFSLTISQGLEILNGKVPDDAGVKSTDFDSTAATKYLESQTYEALTDLYAPKIDTSLDKDLIGSISATEAWTELTLLYNNFTGRSDVQAAVAIANFAGAGINLPDQIETDLGVFSTQKALNGLFYMVGQEEKKIRKDPYQWAIDIIQKVFGSLQ